MSRFHFKTDIKYDLALLSETNSLNPYSLPLSKATKIWEVIATNLKSSLLALPVTSRRCRERVTQLLMEHKKQEQLSVKSSGIQEADMDQLKLLLTSILSLEEVRPVLMDKNPDKKSRKEADDTRKRALLELAENNNCEEVIVDATVDEESNQKGSETKEGVTSTQTTMDGDIPDAKKPRNGVESKGPEPKGTEALIAYLKTKNKSEADYRTEELKVRSLEAENRKLELELQKQKQDVELQDKKRMTDLLLKLVEAKTKTE